MIQQMIMTSGMIFKIILLALHPLIAYLKGDKIKTVKSS